MEDPAAAAAAAATVDDEHDSKECVLQRYFLQEWLLLKSLLDRILFKDGVSRPSDVSKIRSIIDKYQEQGQLLEPYLETIVSPLMAIVRSRAVQAEVASNEVLDIIKPLCIIIYSLVTVCGYKSVIRFFPHQVSDLELCVSLLEKSRHATSGTSLRHESTGEMEMQSILLLWLYILVLIPFDLSSVDTSIANSSYLSGSHLSPLVLKILDISKGYLSTAGPMRRISGLLLSRLLTRPDMPNAFNSFMGWAHEILLSVAEDVSDHFKLLGVVEALASTFKVGFRKNLISVATTTWSDCSVLMKSATANRSPLLRKFLVKLSQRIGLTCLPPRVPSWCYLGQNRLLGEHIMQSACEQNIPSLYGHPANQYDTISDAECLDEEDMDVPEIVEEIIELLLSGLRDSDTVVRWSAAKGIGRITARLTSSLSEDVLSSVLELFSSGEGDGSWHGGCLALAELARRGLLLPFNFPKVVPVIIKALHYDIRRGPHSIGSHVRDAAAYVCWAFGRAYSISDMKGILEQLAPHLLTVACYDREVNCRRAASAAFQENVGRQGTFPHGIDIVNAADYFSLATRAHSYLNVAVFIAQYKEFLYIFVEELISCKISHWDDKPLVCIDHFRQCSHFVVDDPRVQAQLTRTGFRHFSRLSWIRLDWSLITTLTERWRPETWTFHLHVGEMTVTLQDVAVLLGLRIDVPAVISHTDRDWQHLIVHLLGRAPDARRGAVLKLTWLREAFPPPGPDASVAEIEQYTRAYILHHIGTSLFPDRSKATVHCRWLTVLENLDVCGTLSWGSAVLAYLYSELSLAALGESKLICGCLTLLQLWSWIRLSVGVPTFGAPPAHDPLAPFGSRFNVTRAWDRTPDRNILFYRDELDRLAEVAVVWRPYTLEILQTLPDICTAGANIWHARTTLLCFQIVALHLPDRVLRQFDLCQHIPSPIIELLPHVEIRGRADADWPTIYAVHILTWNSRAQHIVETVVSNHGLFGYTETVVSNHGFTDKSLRELAGKALSSLARYDVDYFAGHVLDKLVPNTLSLDLCMRHGATLAAGELVLTLHQCGFNFSTEKQKTLSCIVPAIEKARLYRGKGGEIMRSAVSRFIECLSHSKVSLSEKSKKCLLDTLNENLKHPNAQIQCAAVEALKHLAQVYLIGSSNKVSDDIALKYLEYLDDPNVAARRGGALALGRLPCEFFAGRWKAVIKRLCSSCLIEDKPEDPDAEARVNAVRGLVLVCETLIGASENWNSEEEISLYLLIKDEVVRTLFKALDDYSVDNRGDVGSWVREAAMDGLERCTYFLCRGDSIGSMKISTMVHNADFPAKTAVTLDPLYPLFDTDVATNLVGGIAKQAVEKMDKLRDMAAKILRRILHNKLHFIPSIPHSVILQDIIPPDTNLKWADPSVSYPRLVRLLDLSCYSRYVLSGLIISVGGLQESLCKASMAALLEYIQVPGGENVEKRIDREHRLCSDLLWILEHHQKCDRVITPAFKTIEILMSKQVFIDMEGHVQDFGTAILNSLAIELKGSKDFTKLLTGLSILGYVASFAEPIDSRALSQLLYFLGHRYPKIRKAAADQVYLVLLQNGNLVAGDQLERVLEILTETCWEGAFEESKLGRSYLYEIIGIIEAGNLPRVTKTNKNSEKSFATDENASYSSLVDSSGF